jgi:hypothetical protein
MTNYFSVSDLDEGKKLDWTNVHNSMLQKNSFIDLSNKAKLDFILICLLASDLDNKLPVDSVWIRNKINGKHKIDLDILFKHRLIEFFNESKKPVRLNTYKMDSNTAFEEFWIHYPVKVSKKKAKEIYIKKITGSLHDVVITAVENQKRDRDLKARHNIFVPVWKNPTTWLNQECWNDGVVFNNSDLVSEIKRGVYGRESNRPVSIAINRIKSDYKR